MYRYLSIAAVVLSTAFSGPALAEGINSFSQAKAAAVKVHADAPGTFYCGCKINWQGKKGVVDLQSCGWHGFHFFAPDSRTIADQQRLFCPAS